MSASQQTILGLLCVSLMVTSEQNITARSRCLSRICPIFNSRCRRVRFARFYIVCEEVPLGTPESPLIVCGLSDTLRECPNVAKTRNGMPAAAWKKYVNFASKNLPPSVYSGTFLFSGLLIILLIKANMICLLGQFHKKTGQSTTVLRLFFSHFSIIR